MNPKQFVSIIDLILHWVTSLALINVLWYLFTLRGLVIGGVFPATTAVLGVSRKMILKGTDVNIWKTFNQVYREEYLQSNILGWFLSGIGGLLYINYKIIANSAGEIAIITLFAFYLVLFFYSIIVLWSFPLLAHYKSTWIQHLKNAFIIGFTKVHYTFAIGLMAFAVMYFSFEYPGLVPFFSISMVATGGMWFSLQIFTKIDQDAT